MKIIKKLASLKLAVFIIVAIAILTAVGTIIESKYDAEAAKKWVYDTFWMYAIMGTLVVNLIAVIVDRYPWKKRHVAFICAHVGIITLLFGSLLTMQWGLDGSLPIKIGSSNRMVTVPETEVMVYSTFDGQQYVKLLEKPVDFFRKPPTLKKPIEIATDGGVIKIIDYKKYILPSRKVVETANASAGAALRFQIHNDKVNVIEWLVQSRPGAMTKHEFGPAKIFFGYFPVQSQGGNEIYITPDLKSKTTLLRYEIFHKEQKKPFKSGVLKEGESVETGWMGLQLKILRFFPQAQEEWDIQERETPTPLTTSAVKVQFNEKESWLLLNDTAQFFTQKAAYVVSYGQRRIDIGFPIQLKKFDVDRYQGTRKAMSYRSQVFVDGLGDYEISMNEPLKWKGLTFYQASFQEDDKGEPTASVLSVNYDPGRWWKYLGSLVMSLGIILLFYFKTLDFRRSRQK